MTMSRTSPGGPFKDAAVVVDTQQFACLTIVSNDWRIRSISDNAPSILGLNPEEYLGRAFEDVFDTVMAHRLRSRSQGLTEDDPILHIQNCPHPAHELGLHVTAVLCDGHYVFAFEHPDANPNPASDVEQVQRLINRVARKDTLAAAATEAARGLRALNVMDRVSLHPIRAGRVWPAVGQTTGHPFPRGVPRDVLDAFTEEHAAWAHYLPSLEDTPSQLQSDPPLPADFDISRLPSRLPPPALRDALRNAGVQSAHSVPVMQYGRLWGVFLCHHSLPGLPGFAQRSIMTVFATLLGHTLSAIAARETAQAQTRAAILREGFLDALEQGLSFEAAFAQMRHDLVEAIPCTGLALWREDSFHSYQAVVTEQDLTPLLTERNMLLSGEVFCAGRLTDLGVTKADTDPARTGVMVVPMSGHARDMALFFRTLQDGEDGSSLWAASDLAAADVLRSGFLEAQVRLSAQIEHDRQEVRGKKAHLMDDLGQRVGNMLALIRKSAPNLPDISDAAVDARIKTLVDAHTYLTDQPHSWVGLQTLMRRSMAGLDPDAAARLTITGPGVDLSPAAFATLALVLNEMMMNALQHGALSNPHGKIELSLDADLSGHAVLEWRESNGPVISGPVRSGLGLSLVRDMVPFELNGTVQYSFDAHGFAATLVVPPAHVRAFAVLSDEVDQDAPTHDVLDGVVALVLDDSLLVAMDAADLLTTLGARHVYTCITSDLASQYLERGDVGFALLDVNLGTHTSQALAKQLHAAGIPVALATGYATDGAALEGFPNVPVLIKPYALRDLAGVVKSAMDARRATMR